MKLLTAVILSFALSTLAYGQEASISSNRLDSTSVSPPGAEPDLPGTLTVDFGFNFLQGAPDNLDLQFFKSKGVGLYYLYDMPIGESKFSFHPGLGVGFESYAFSQNVTLAYAPGADSVDIVNLDGAIYETVDKSKLVTHYVDVPLEFRFYSKENYRGFMAAVGAKVGYLFSSYTKIKYETEGEPRTSKLRQDFNINRLRYGVSARLGFRGFNLHGQYMLSDLFKSGGGPEVNNFKVGLSIALF